MTTEIAPSPSLQIPASTRRSDLLGYTAWGTGVGVSLREKELIATIVRIRPNETAVLGAATVTDYRTRPAAEWGGELLAFLRKLGVAHIAATVLLPRRDVIVRALPLPGVSDRDLEAAIRLQIDSLHPFADEDVCFSHSRLGTSAFVLVGIARRSVVDGWSALFAEAGIKVASFTFSAGAVYAALRVVTTPPPNFVCAHEVEGGGIELYGESEARPIYSATLPMQYERAVGIARAELRLDPATPSTRLAHLLPKPAVFPAEYDPQSLQFEANILPYATAVAGACPWLGIESNLLPPELRRASSRVRLIPTVTLATLLLVLLVMLGFQQSWADTRYLGVLQHEIRRYEPQARKVEALDKNIASVRARSQSLDEFKRRSRLDIDSLAEITKLIPPPGWVSTLDMDRATIQIGGEADQVESLLKIIDKSPLFERSELTMPISKTATGEVFRIRAQRTVPPLASNAPTPAPAPPAQQSPQQPTQQPTQQQQQPTPQPAAAPAPAKPAAGGAK